MNRIKSDADMARVLRRFDRLLEKVRELNDEIRDSAHPNAGRIADALDAECVHLTWPSHVAHDHLEHPEEWETGAHDIRRKAKP